MNIKSILYLAVRQGISLQPKPSTPKPRGAIIKSTQPGFKQAVQHHKKDASCSRFLPSSNIKSILHLAIRQGISLQPKPSIPKPRCSLASSKLFKTIRRMHHLKISPVVEHQIDPVPCCQASGSVISPKPKPTNHEEQSLDRRSLAPSRQFNTTRKMHHAQDFSCR